MCWRFRSSCGRKLTDRRENASRPFIGSEPWLVVPPPKEINEIWPPGKAGLAAVVLAWRGMQQRIAGEPSRGDSITSG